MAAGLVAAGLVALSERRGDTLRSFVMMLVICVSVGVFSHQYRSQQRALKEKADVVKQRFLEQKGRVHSEH